MDPWYTLFCRLPTYVCKDDTMHGVNNITFNFLFSEKFRSTQWPTNSPVRFGTDGLSLGNKTAEA